MRKIPVAKKMMNIPRHIELGDFNVIKIFSANFFTNHLSEK